MNALWADNFIVDPHDTQRAFDRAATHYDEGADLQREVADHLLERLQYIDASPKKILDIGSGTGYPTQKLVRSYPGAQTYALDLAFGMLQVSRSRCSEEIGWYSVNADMHEFPIVDESIDLVFSSLAVQWSNDLGEVFKEIRRVLRPGGVCLFSTLGAGTLFELATSWKQADGFDHVNQFVDMKTLGDELHESGLQHAVVDADTIVMRYPDVRGLMRDLKTIGANNRTAGRCHGLTGKGRLQRMMAAYESFREGETVPATYRVLYGRAVKA